MFTLLKGYCLSVSVTNTKGFISTTRCIDIELCRAVGLGVVNRQTCGQRERLKERRIAFSGIFAAYNRSLHPDSPEELCVFLLVLERH
ncbi:unnamed protein product [Brassica oleracea]